MKCEVAERVVVRPISDAEFRERSTQAQWATAERLMTEGWSLSAHFVLDGFGPKGERVSVFVLLLSRAGSWEAGVFPDGTYRKERVP